MAWYYVLFIEQTHIDVLKFVFSLAQLQNLVFVRWS